jgi:hypothetical protein
MQFVRPFRHSRADRGPARLAGRCHTCDVVRPACLTRTGCPLGLQRDLHLLPLRSTRSTVRAVRTGPRTDHSIASRRSIRSGRRPNDRILLPVVMMMSSRRGCRAGAAACPHRSLAHPRRDGGGPFIRAGLLLVIRKVWNEQPAIGRARGKDACLAPAVTTVATRRPPAVLVLPGEGGAATWTAKQRSRRVSMSSQPSYPARRSGPCTRGRQGPVMPTTKAGSFATAASAFSVQPNPVGNSRADAGGGALIVNRIW